MKKRYLQIKTIRGQTRHLVIKTKRLGGKRVQKSRELHAAPGTREYDMQYWAALNEIQQEFADDAAVKAVAKSWEALVQHYRATPRYRKLAHATRRSYERSMLKLLDGNAQKDVRSTTRRGVRALHEKYSHTPAEADRLVVVIRILMNFARVELEWLDKNPADGIKLHGTQQEREPWPAAAQRSFENACRNLGEQDALTIFMLGVGTGQRSGDLCKMEWSHYDGQYISVRQEKTKARIDVFCPSRLREYLDALPRRGAFILAKNATEPITYDSLQKIVKRIREATSIPDKYTMHGWRYVAAVELAEAGCSDAEIASVTGHSTQEMVRKYREKADQRKLSKRAQEKRR